MLNDEVSGKTKRKTTKMKQFKNLITMSLFSLLFGCNKSSNSSTINLTEISNVEEQEEGFQDIVLKIVSEEKNK